MPYVLTPRDAGGCEPGRFVLPALTERTRDQLDARLVQVRRAVAGEVSDWGTGLTKKPVPPLWRHNFIFKSASQKAKCRRASDPFVVLHHCHLPLAWNIRKAKLTKSVHTRCNARLAA
jgi:hypothetical protein